MNSEWDKKSRAITAQQRHLLDSLVCERFRDHAHSNRAVLQRFDNPIGLQLIAHALQDGFSKDLTGETAYYIVKTKTGDGLLFFSLQCGELFQPFVSEDAIRAQSNNLLVLKQAVANAVHDPNIVGKIYNKLVARINAKRKKAKKQMMVDFAKENEIEPNRKISYVDKIFSGIQLVHFCANKGNAPLWNEFGFPRRMGETLFWQSVVPVIEKTIALVGCKYVFLFAADFSQDNSLTEYYQQAMKFEFEDSVGVNKPRYDFRCAFMCQKVSALHQNRKQFFANFNMKPNLTP